MGNEEREIMYADAGNGLEGDLTVENDGSQLHRTELKEQSKDWSEKIVLFLKKYLLYVGLISGAICLLSIILLIVCRTSNTPAHCEENCLKSDYTNCINSDDVPKTCADTLAEEKSQKECICYMKFNVTSLIKGNVTMYYHLDYDQTAYANSIDVDQLRGILSPKPSSNCGNYTYTPQGQPIAPCGELADSMFTAWTGRVYPFDQPQRRRGPDSTVPSTSCAIKSYKHGPDECIPSTTHTGLARTTLSFRPIARHRITDMDQTSASLQPPTRGWPGRHCPFDQFQRDTFNTTQ